MESHAGKHLMLDLYNCNPSCIYDILNGLEKICIDIGAVVVKTQSHYFDDGGSSGAIILAESHCSWHHWIEEKYVSIDIFTCGSVDPFDAISGIVDLFGPEEYETHFVVRGRNFKNSS